MLRNLTIAALFLLGSAAAAGAVAAPAGEAALEHAFEANIHPDDLRRWMQVLAAEPNQVGSAHDKSNAEFILAHFRKWGWDAHIETFDVLYPTPVSETVELLNKTHFKATLRERPVAGDASSQRTADELPAYLIYAADGDVTGDLVYVNYGTVEDYLALQRLGVSVRGKIVIARYGKIWRGLKVAFAQQHGAIGCILYSDPQDDGYAVGDTYPKGPMRPPFGIQRGSAMIMTVYPGDPLTPGVAATKDAKRLPISQSPTIQKIPALPISYGDAQVLLGTLKGDVVPPAWRGALPITYHVGPGDVKVHLAVKSDWKLKPIYDVIATMKGSKYPDRWVIRGNHHDGWVFGASDPMAGQVALLAEAKSIGMLAKQGWRPQRTLVYASWDGEEPMLLGSTEWVEAHAAELQRKTILYINSDENTRGTLWAEGSADFAHLFDSVAADIQDPETGASIGARMRAKLRLDAYEAGPRADKTVEQVAKLAADPKADVPLRPLGSGTDFSSFVDHLGIPALNIGFGGEGHSGGVYHSAYDTFEHHSRFVDPGFRYDALLAKTCGVMALRVAEAAEPEQRAGDFATAISGYVKEIEQLAKTKRELAQKQAAMLRDKVFRLADDPALTGAPPAPLEAVPAFDFSPLDAAAARLQRAAAAYDRDLAAASLTADRAQRLQDLMGSIDQTLISNVGLPGRPWYRNLVYAPGSQTGYGAKTLPGVREAIEQQHWSDVGRYMSLTANALNAYSDRLDRADAVLKGR